MSISLSRNNLRGILTGMVSFGRCGKQLLDFDWYIQRGAKQGCDTVTVKCKSEPNVPHVIKITVTGRSRIVWRLRERRISSNHNSDFPNYVVEKAHTFCWPRTTRTTNRKWFLQVKDENLGGKSQKNRGPPKYRTLIYSGFGKWSLLSSPTLPVTFLYDIRWFRSKGTLW